MDIIDLHDLILNKVRNKVTMDLMDVNMLLVLILLELEIMMYLAFGIVI
jgi:hypothetical protein